ncbi:uncharacterized oxidoreductase TM_0325-like [Bradysia coprophila]|uniref:uncharacterized oxidoreductase TM_0325-like n=1 Tax=Bradysia coprophila TaxID=38358 RepID=UPI00187D9EA2|nr:uncharacterized oxidoreductase TM_0325-like [Bradysia coprophila]
MIFEDKVILITGAGSGIGADASRHLAKLGGKIALVDCHEKNVLDVAEQIKKAGSPTPLVIVADVAVDAKRIINETIKHFQKLNVLINNAGIAHFDDVTTFEMDKFDRLFAVNVKGVIELTQLAVPFLKQTKGNIINTASVAALMCESNILSYSISKAAVNQFTKNIALDLAPFGIRANSINPGVIRTPLVGSSMGLSPEKMKLLFQALKASHPVGRTGEVSDTSAAIAYLASDAASFLTGVLLPVDGGSLLVRSFDLQKILASDE